MAQSESDHSDDEGLGSFGEVLGFISPYLLPDQADAAKSLLNDLGVLNRSDLLKVEYSHLNSIMKLVQYKKMIEELKTSDNSISTTNPQQAPSYQLNLNGLLSQPVLRHLKGENILTKYNRRKVMNLVVDDIYENKGSVITEKYLLRVAEHLVGSYKKAFGCTDDNQRSEAAFGLKNSMVYHLRYLQRTNKTGSGRPVAQNLKKTGKSHNYGLVCDLPEAPDGEGSLVMENRRELLVSMFKSGDLNQKLIVKLMKESYIAIRRDINNELIMEDLLVKWPFIGNPTVLIEHFEILCDKPEPDLTFLGEWIEFFQYQSHQTRKGNKKLVPLELAKAIKSWDKKEETRIIVIILCILKHLDIPEGDIFLKFEETTSFDEIQASELLPNHGRPVLCLLGSDPIKNPKSYLIIEKRCTSEVPTSTAKGLVLFIMSYFIFKIPYQPRTAPVLDFMQRKILRIEGGGSKVERQRTAKGWGHASPEVSSKYITLIRDFNFFRNTFM